MTFKSSPWQLLGGLPPLAGVHAVVSSASQVFCSDLGQNVEGFMIRATTPHVKYLNGLLIIIITLVSPIIWWYIKTQTSAGLLS